MDESIISSATTLRVPSDLLTWLAEQPDLRAAWESCNDPEWVVALARVGGVPVLEILQALAKCFRELKPPAGSSPDVVRMDVVLREILDAYERRAPTDATKTNFKTILLPLLQDMNIGRDYERHGQIEGIPPPPAHDLWPFLNRANAIARLHEQFADHVNWPWPGRLALVVRWLVHDAASDSSCSPGLTREQVSALLEREPSARTALAGRLRALIRLPANCHARGT